MRTLTVLLALANVLLSSAAAFAQPAALEGRIIARNGDALWSTIYTAFANPAGDVIVHGVLSEAYGFNYGMFFYPHDGSDPQLVIREGNPTDGTGIYVSVTPRNDPRLDGMGNAVMRLEVNDIEGLYRWNAGSATIERLLRPGDPCPNVGGETVLSVDDAGTLGTGGQLHMTYNGDAYVYYRCSGPSPVFTRWAKVAAGSSTFAPLFADGTLVQGPGGTNLELRMSGVYGRLVANRFGDMAFHGLLYCPGDADCLASPHQPRSTTGIVRYDAGTSTWRTVSLVYEPSFVESEAADEYIASAILMTMNAAGDLAILAEIGDTDHAPTRLPGIYVDDGVDTRLVVREGPLLAGHARVENISVTDRSYPTFHLLGTGDLILSAKPHDGPMGVVLVGATTALSTLLSNGTVVTLDEATTGTVMNYSRVAINALTGNLFMSVGTEDSDVQNTIVKDGVAIALTGDILTDVYSGETLELTTFDMPTAPLSSSGGALGRSFYVGQNGEDGRGSVVADGYILARSANAVILLPITPRGGEPTGPAEPGDGSIALAGDYDGDRLYFDVTATGESLEAATFTAIELTVPTGGVMPNDSLPAGCENILDADGLLVAVRCTSPFVLNMGEQQMLRIPVRRDTFAGIVRYEAGVTAAVTDDPNLSNNTATTAIDVAGADLALSIEGDLSPALRFITSNSGPEEAIAVTLTVVAGADVVEVEALGGAPCSVERAADAPIYTWTCMLGNIASGETRAVVVRGPVMDMIRASVTSLTDDPDPSNNMATGALVGALDTPGGGACAVGARRSAASGSLLLWFTAAVFVLRRVQRRRRT